MSEKIAVGIVIFNPDNKDRVQKLLESILDQVDTVYVFDNSTVSNCIRYPSTIKYLTEHENKGVAYAMNRIMERAMADGFDWLITMDQDSIIPLGMIEAYKMHSSDEDIGIICPQVIDTWRSYIKVKKDPKEEIVEFCITSASCTRISAWEKVGKFDEWLFIDLVDNDFCKRMVVSGYKILKLNEFILEHEFGEIIPKSERFHKFWNMIARFLHNDNFAKLGYKKFVSPMRVYYKNRNIIYVNKKLRCYGKIGYRNYNCKGYLGFLIAFVIPSILRAQEKRKVLYSTFKGIRDGLRVKPNLGILGNK